jgi:hypothetical protein
VQFSPDSRHIRRRSDIADKFHRIFRTSAPAGGSTSRVEHQRHAESSTPCELGDQATLPADRAFVIQFACPTAADMLIEVGRVEHLTSGAATHFATWPELRRFVEQALAHTCSERLAARYSARRRWP